MKASAMYMKLQKQTKPDMIILDAINYVSDQETVVTHANSCVISAKVNRNLVKKQLKRSLSVAIQTLTNAKMFP